MMKYQIGDCVWCPLYRDSVPDSVKVYVQYSEESSPALGYKQFQIIHIEEPKIYIEIVPDSTFFANGTTYTISNWFGGKYFGNKYAWYTFAQFIKKVKIRCQLCR